MSMDLATRQRAMLTALKGRSAVDDQGDADTDAELRGILQSQHLPMLREILLWWRSFAVTRCCPLSSAILRRRGDFDAFVMHYVRDTRGSPYLDGEAEQFLSYTINDPDPLVAAVATTERALHRLRDDPGYRCVLRWCHDPAVVFAYLVNRIEFDEAAIEGRYLVRIAEDLPGGIDWQDSGSHGFGAPVRRLYNAAVIRPWS